MAKEAQQVQWTTRYPWEKWANGAPWEIFQGEDFTCQMDSMIALLGEKAPRFEMKVRYRKTSDTSIAFQFYQE